MERRRKEPHPTQLSAIGAAISALVGPTATFAPVAARIALDDGKTEPPARRVSAIPFYDVHARLREAREFDRQEAIETARLVELARLSARAEYEAQIGTASSAEVRVDARSAREAHERRLTPAQETEIRARLAKGDTKASLAREFGVSRPIIAKYESTSERGNGGHSNDPFGLAAAPKVNRKSR